MNSIDIFFSQNDLDPTETYLTLIPGFEGRHQIFSSVAERLKVQAVAVQLAPDIEGYSIPEMAATVRKVRFIIVIFLPLSYLIWGQHNTSSSSTLLYSPSWHHPLLSLTYHSEGKIHLYEKKNRFILRSSPGSSALVRKKSELKLKF